ncbi:MAG: saccharopine dehydrogenase [Methanosarcinales archaeon]|nr:saccharopine dehydrogenase [Methanosarcinales archaeon]
MKALVFGAGKIGSVAAWDLARNRDVDAVGLVGRTASSLQARREWIGSDKVALHPLDIGQSEKVGRLMSGYDVGVITLPDRRSSYDVVRLAVEAGLDVVDVLEEYHRRPEPYETEGLQVPPGMSLDQFGEDLHSRAKDGGVALLDGMGFAPGLSNVTVGQGIRSMDRALGATARVGGIPTRESAARHPLRYMITWSFNHVLREYSVPVRVISDGRVAEVPATSGRETFRFQRCGQDEELECAITPGMPSFLYTRPQLRQFSEKTVRWPGHWQGVDLLKECGLLDLQPVDFNGALISPREFFLALVEPRLRPLPQDQDVCVMWNTVVGEKDGLPSRKDYYMWLDSDRERGISAMARVTGFSAAVGAMLLGRGLIREKGILAPEDAIAGRLYREFMQELSRRGVEVEEIQEEGSGGAEVVI